MTRGVRVIEVLAQVAEEEIAKAAVRVEPPSFHFGSEGGEEEEEGEEEEKEEEEDQVMARVFAPFCSKPLL